MHSVDPCCHVLIRELVLSCQQSGKNSDCQLLAELEQAGFSFLKGFDSSCGTQAFLAQLKVAEDQQAMLILAFRGTETKAIEDIRTDARLKLQDAPGGGRVHPGFYEAFDSVRAEI